MTDYVLAHAGDERERERLTLLERFHGPLTVAQLEPLVRPGWRCLEAGAGGGGMTTWLAERVAPGGSVLAVDLETHWLERLRSAVIDVRALDITTDKLPSDTFDLVLARMLLLHLPDPAEACRQLLATARSDATLVVQDADFTAVALDDASALEAEGLRTMTDMMRASGVDLALGPNLPALLESAGADVVTIDNSPSPGHGNGLAARIVAITIERFRARSISNGTTSAAIDAAISALRDPNRSFTGPTQWIVRARPTNGLAPSRL
jgi:SAM-dependent methyltransferase